MDNLPLVQHVILYVQHTFFTASRPEHAYFVFLLLTLLTAATEKLRHPDRKLRNRSDRTAWGRR